VRSLCRWSTRAWPPQILAHATGASAKLSVRAPIMRHGSLQVAGEVGSALRMSDGVSDRANAGVHGVAIKTIRRWRRMYQRHGLPRGTWKHWPCLCPQHGVGRKHLRKIELGSLATGDRCRVPPNAPAGLLPVRELGSRPGTDSRYCSVRYWFSNESEGIRKILTDALICWVSVAGSCGGMRAR
jgi:hypothetical protein